MADRRIKARIIICGGRHFNDYDALESLVDSVLAENDLTDKEVEIVSGHCEGADILGEQYAKNHGIICKVFPAEWTKYGRAAGPIRNSQMIEYASESHIPIVIAFVSPHTKGTMDTIKKATKRGFAINRQDYDSTHASGLKIIE